MKENLEIVYDHYKDTFNTQKEYIKTRQLYTLICIGIVSLFSIQIVNSKEVENISSSIMLNKLGIKINLLYINHLMTFSFLWVTILYFQICVLIERRYNYLHKLETELSDNLKPLSIDREKGNYLSEYPVLSNFVDKIYKWIFPLVFILVSSIRIGACFKYFQDPLMSSNFWVEFVFLLAQILICFFYISYVHFNDFRKKAH